MQDNYVLILYVKKWFDCIALGQVGRCENFMFFFPPSVQCLRGNWNSNQNVQRVFFPSTALYLAHLNNY